MTITKIAKPDPGQIYVALSSFASTEGGGFLIKAGARLRGDHPLVKRLPQKFVPDGLSDAELATVRAERRPAPEPSSEPTKPAPREIPVARRWIVREDFTMGGYGQVFHKGSAHDQDDEIVKAAPQMFDPAIPKE